MKRIVLAVCLLLAAAAGGYYYYDRVYLPQQSAAASTEAPLQTSLVRMGDIVISAQGAGTLVPARQLDLAFGTSGKLTELSVDVGDQVDAGQVVARLDDAGAQNQVAQAEFSLAQAEQSLAELTSSAAIAQAQLDVANQQVALADAQKKLNNLLTPAVSYYAEALASAQRSYASASASAEMVDTGSRSKQAALESAQTAADNAYSNWQHAIIWYGENHGRTQDAAAAYERAQEDLRVAQLEYDLAASNQQASLADAQAALDTAQANYNYATHYTPPSDDVAVAQANVAVAQASLDQAQARLAELQGQPLPEGAISTLADARNAITQAQLALDEARQTLANTTLTSPITGTVTAVSAEVGETVGSGAVLTVADLDNARVEFYIDESDLAYVEKGYPVDVVFDAAPEASLTGSVLRVDPALVSVNGTSVVQAWATLDPVDSSVRLIAGMNGTVEITAAEARGVLLVPIEALRELAPGSYAVFVVQADGTLKLTPVQVGLQDAANAEIKSGLSQGDRVSTGVVETGQ